MSNIAEKVDFKKNLYRNIIIFLASILTFELVIFKFTPDLGITLVQAVKTGIDQSPLVSFDVYIYYFKRAGSVFYPRFLASDIQYYLAEGLARFVHSSDIRMHPLRIAEGVMVPIYFTIGVIPAILAQKTYNTIIFMTLYAFVCAMSLYTFTPYDIACASLLSLGLWFLLNGQLLLCLTAMIVAGPVRESSLHIVFFVALAALLTPGRLPVKFGWVAVFGLFYSVEYIVIRHFFPAPVSSEAWSLETVKDIFLGPGVVSLTSIFSVGLAILFPLAVLLEIPANGDWRAKFFRLNAYAFPIWMLFYRLFNGNLSEFRIFLPMFAPLIFALSRHPFLTGGGAEVSFPWSSSRRTMADGKTTHCG